jgi:release factor glutamine methyltransferase
VPEVHTPQVFPAHEDTVREVGERLATVIGGPRARRDAREILSLVWDRTPGWVSAHADDTVPEAVRDAAASAACRHAAGEPLAYAAGRAAFRNLLLEVDARVLIPRPETEVVVEEALRVCSTGVAVDAGTGSGAIALALASEGRYDRVIATDVSADALTVARRNAALIHTPCSVEFRSGSLLAPLGSEQVDLVVSNPPYIAASEIPALPASVRDWEPTLALLSGDDGLEHTRLLVRAAVGSLRAGGWLVIEVDSTRAEAVGTLIAAQAEFTDVAIRPDLTGRPRVAIARRTNANPGESA